MVRECSEVCPECGEQLRAISVPCLGCVVRPRRMTRCPKYRRGSYRDRHICRSVGTTEAEALAKFLRREIV